MLHCRALSTKPSLAGPRFTYWLPLDDFGPGADLQRKVVATNAFLRLGRNRLIELNSIDCPSKAENCLRHAQFTCHRGERVELVELR
jgi:hypothetical protein